MKRNPIRPSLIHLAGRGGYGPVLITKPENQRASLLILIMFVIFVLSIPKYDITGVIIFAVFPALMITAGPFPLRAIIKRILLLSPFILIMASANPFLDRSHFTEIAGITISAGIVTGMVILLKSLLTITAIIAFSFCIPFYRICELLREFHVPDAFVTQLALLYRYSFLLVDEAMAMQRARNMRSFGNRGKDIFTTAKLIGSLMLRTHDRADRIYRGMLARGFNGYLTFHKREPVRPGEIFCIVGTFLIFLVIRMIF